MDQQSLEKEKKKKIVNSKMGYRSNNLQENGFFTLKYTRNDILK